MRKFHKEEGFTLVELMVVVLIIGILVAVAIPVFNSAKANAQKKSCYANQRTIEGACQSYQAEYGTLPTAGAVDANHVLVKPAADGTSYIKSAPFCPADTAKGAYTLSADKQTVADCTFGSPAHGHF